MAKGIIHIGTSGWFHPQWVGSFYPKSLSGYNFLGYYADHFQTTEICHSFHQKLNENTLMQWRNKAPDEFLFSFTANRYITQIKKLRYPGTTLPDLIRQLRVLGDKLAVTVFRLPPHWRCNPGRLRLFLEALPQGFRYAFEFRDASWFNDEIYEILARHNAAFVIFQVGKRTSAQKITADFVYVRLWGAKGLNKGDYDEMMLRTWAERLNGWASEGKNVYCYFDNEENGFAPVNAHRLKQLVA